MLWSSSTIALPPWSWWRLPQVIAVQSAGAHRGRDSTKPDRCRAGIAHGASAAAVAEGDELNLEPKYVLVTRRPTDVAGRSRARQVSPIRRAALDQNGVDA